MVSNANKPITNNNAMKDMLKSLPAIQRSMTFNTKGLKFKAFNIDEFNDKMVVLENLPSSVEKEIYLIKLYDNMVKNHGKNDMKEIISAYARDILKYNDDKINKAFFNRKPDAALIMKGILEMKKMVENFDVREIYKFSQGLKHYVDADNLDKIK